MHFKIPIESPMDKVMRTTRTLVTAINKMQGKSNVENKRHIDALSQLAEIFQVAFPEKDNQEETITLRTSTNPTAPAVL